jgi:hypothetical protein
MQTGFIGLGSVVETAYLPALRRLGACNAPPYGHDIDPARQPDGVVRCDSLDALLARPLDIVFITTSSTQHLVALQAALASAVPRIVVEKPVVADLEQMRQLRALLALPGHAARVLALDHWTARSAGLRDGRVAPAWQPVPGQSAAPTFTLDDVVHLEGWLEEVSGFNDQGEPIALNFATGQADTRQLRHPDGVIVDIGTHVLALLREIVHALGGSDSLVLELVDAHDRLGRPIARGDLTTAEGDAHLRGTLAGIPLDLRLNKYAGPAGGQKGIRIHLRDGRVLRQDRRGNSDVIEVGDGAETLRWSLPGPIYDHRLGALLAAPDAAFANATAETARRMDEVETLLRLQQVLRGPH